MKTTTKLFAIVAVFATVLFSSCKKEETSKPSVKPIETLIKTKMEFSSYDIDDFTRTMAIVFKSSKAGKITHLGAKLEPGTYNVALLDSSSRSVLSTTTVTISDTSNYAYTKISDIAIVANKFYYVTVNNATTSNTLNKKYFSYNLLVDNFPQTDGNFTYLEPEFLLNTTDATKIIDDGSYLQNNGITGVPSFIFEEN